MDNEAQAFPARLRRLREHLGHNVPKFAEIVGLAPSTIRRYEAGRQKIHTGSLLAIGDATECSIDWLMTGRLQRDLPRDDAVPQFRSRRAA